MLLEAFQLQFGVYLFTHAQLGHLVVVLSGHIKILWADVDHFPLYGLKELAGRISFVNNKFKCSDPRSHSNLSFYEKVELQFPID